MNTGLQADVCGSYIYLYKDKLVNSYSVLDVADARQTAKPINWLAVVIKPRLGIAINFLWCGPEGVVSVLVIYADSHSKPRFTEPFLQGLRKDVVSRCVEFV